MKFFVFILGVSLFPTCQKKAAIVFLDGSKSKNYTILSWRQISGNGEIEDNRKVRPKVVFNKSMVSYFELTVKNDSGQVDKDTVKVTVIK